jgi:hypothetical protein
MGLGRAEAEGAGQSARIARIDVDLAILRAEQDRRTAAQAGVPL